MVIDEMTNEELNKAAAEMCGSVVRTRPVDGKEVYVGRPLMLCNDDGIFGLPVEDWNPAGDMNQIIGYIFPKLRDAKCWIDITDSRHRFCIKISRPEKWSFKRTCDSGDSNEIKLSVLKACLKVWELIK